MSENQGFDSASDQYLLTPITTDVFSFSTPALPTVLDIRDLARIIADSIPPSGHRGSHYDSDRDFFRARVEAILGEPATAVTYLRAANASGVPYHDILGVGRIDFETMWDYRPLRRLLAGHSCEGI